MRVKGIVSTLLGLAIIASVLPAAQVVEAAPPSNEYTLMYQDEFNQTSLNTNDWYYRTGFRIRGDNRAANVAVNNGSLHIYFKDDVNADLNNDGKQDYSSGGIISKKLFGYGYYETRAKLLNNVTGLHTSFWSYGLKSPSDTTSPIYADIAAGKLPYNNSIFEIDGFEQNSKSNITHGTVQYSSQYSKKRSAVWSTLSTSTSYYGIDVADWHVYGYEWTPNGITFYVDGVEKFSIDSNVTPNPYAPINVWLTALGYSNVDNESLLPAESEFDYFRYYAKNYEDANLLANPDLEFSPSSLNTNYPPGWIEYYDTDASKITTAAGEFLGTKAIKQYKSTPYTVTDKQILQYIPNGTYKLTAMVKSSGGQTSAKMRVLNGSNTELGYVNIPAYSTWTQVTLDNIAVSDNSATIAFSSTDSAGGAYLLFDNVNFTAKTSVTEAESNVLSASPSSTNYTLAEARGSSWSNLNATTAGNYIDYTVNVPETGSYKIYVNNRIANNKGKYQMSVDGTNAGSVYDQYSATSDLFENLAGTVTFSTTGNHTIRFTVTGKNAGSSGYGIGVDYIKLWKN